MILRPPPQRLEEDSYTLTVINTGDGLIYHPSSAAHEGKIQFRHAIGIPNVTKAEITCKTWWLALYLLFVKPDASNSVDRLYQQVLPSLNQRPIGTFRRYTQEMLYPH